MEQYNMGYTPNYGFYDIKANGDGTFWVRCMGKNVKDGDVLDNGIYNNRKISLQIEKITSYTDHKGDWKDKELAKDNLFEATCVEVQWVSSEEVWRPVEVKV